MVDDTKPARQRCDRPLMYCRLGTENRARSADLAPQHSVLAVQACKRHPVRASGAGEKGPPPSDPGTRVVEWPRATDRRFRTPRIFGGSSCGVDGAVGGGPGVSQGPDEPGGETVEVGDVCRTRAPRSLARGVAGWLDGGGWQPRWRCLGRLGDQMLRGGGGCLSLNPGAVQ
jgi:hypothetical protein